MLSSTNCGETLSPSSPLMAKTNVASNNAALRVTRVTLELTYTRILCVRRSTAFTLPSRTKCSLTVSGWNGVDWAGNRRSYHWQWRNHWNGPNQRCWSNHRFGPDHRSNPRLDFRSNLRSNHWFWYFEGHHPDNVCQSWHLNRWECSSRKNAKDVLSP